MLVVEAMEECSRKALKKIGDSALAISCDLDPRVEELALKSHAPPRSQLMTDGQIHLWVTHIWDIDPIASWPQASCMQVIVQQSWKQEYSSFMRPWVSTLESS